MRFLSRTILALIICLVMAPAHASIVITGTRAIYPATEKSISITLRNTGKTPSLIQAWVDKGGAINQDRTAGSPFLVTPPVSRLDPEKGLLLKVAYLNEPLPQDRESVFWLNVLEIPSQPSKKDADEESDTSGSLQIAFRSQIKLFYRPTALKGSPSDAAQNLEWTIASSDGRPVLRAINDSPYHISLSKLQLALGGNSHTYNELDMIPPLGNHDIALPDNVAGWAKSGAQVRYTWINDFGGAIETEVSVQ
ncbi:fimbrial biogenesis chaperone [Zestomonas carbonaria]|uniref:fimbrial biogenesis chaperone n=1 Tax=Zestomonas carbonaria TaxID=2762745 RepID=UPI00165748C5|nr:fimbria/pilus periplasmic chaperone [Pseudomonas carbonaria]